MKYFYLLVFCFFTVGSVFADQGGYTITQYHVDMKLHEDASMDVVEQIDVNFSEARHGIYREIPLLDQHNEYLSIDSISVGKDPLAAQMTSNNILSLKIGDANATIMGPKRYVISYTVRNAIKSYSGWAELYRNVIGNEWNITINNSSWSLQLPKNYLPDSTGTFVVRGAKGQQLKDGILFEGKGIQWNGNKIDQLAPGQGITIGMKFPSDYFIFSSDYEKLFIGPTFLENIGGSLTIENGRDLLSRILDNLRIIFIPIIGFSSLRGFFSFTSRKSNKPVALQYSPPKDVDPSIAFHFWYNNVMEPKIFTALLYYWATKGWAVIRKTQSKGFLGFGKSDEFHIIETSNDPQGTSDTDKSLLQEFFGTFDNTNDDIQLNESSHSSIKSLLLQLQLFSYSSGYTQKKQGRKGFLGARELTQSGNELFEYLRGYKEYLSKVEQPVIEKELQADPDFINKILPWATLFGVESRLLKMVEEVLKSIKRYQSDDGSYLTYHTFRSMNSSFKSYSTPPRSSSNSGFGGGGGFSGGGGGGGGGGSW